MSYNCKRFILVPLLIAVVCLTAYAETLRVLAIGNSFSRDAVEQNLHELGAADGVEIIVGNLYIGGCTLERHVQNLRSDSPAYYYRKVGADGKRIDKDKVTMAEALADEPWDYVSLQEVSGKSGIYDSYKTYLPELMAFVKAHTPKQTKFLLHQPWAYAKNSGHGAFPHYGCSQDSMYRTVASTVDRVARDNKIKKIVPSGTAIQNARTSFVGDNLNRDGYHLEPTIGRYTAACAWYEALTGRDVRGNAFAPSGLHPDLKLVAQTAAHEAVAKPLQVTDLSWMQPSEPLYKVSSVPDEIRVEDLLSRMTLEEKVMQLNQYTLGRNNNVNNVGEEVLEIPAEIGSLIYYDTVPDLRNSMQRKAMEKSRLGIPVLFGFDAIHGFRTIYPIGLAQACSWNKPLVQEVCAMSAAETKAAGIDWTFSPMIDVARDPRWGRVSEGYGEDPYANGVFADASVRGYQGKNLREPGKIAACLKHYVGYGASEAGRDYVYTEISPQTLWDTYLPPYRRGVEAGAATLMSAFNDISGVPASANRYTMTEILKDRWKHDGFIVSDWGAIEQLKNQGRVPDKRAAAEAAFNAGLEMDMMSHAYDRHLADLVESGEVSMEQIDDAVRRVLRVKMRLGLFDNPYTPAIDREASFLTPANRDLARRMAVESMVLLKNDTVDAAGRMLPMAGAKRIAVIGPLASNRWDLLGNWCGHGRDTDVKTIYEAIAEEFGDADVVYAQGSRLYGDDRSMIDDAVKAAREADAVVMCLGEMLKWSGENAVRAEIVLPEIQQELAEAVAATGKPLVLVLINGRPLDLSRLEPLSNAILEAWQPGTEGAAAIASILSGNANPSGKLAITFPRATGQIPIYYNRRKSGRHHQGFYQDMPSTPLYEFGHGLSYTDFEYSDIAASDTIVSRKGRLSLSVTVRNTGKVDGSEPVLWFVSDPYSTITRPEKELKHIEKQLIPAGESRTYRFEVNLMRDFGFVDSDGNRFLEEGDYYVMVGPKKIKIKLKD